MIRVFIILLTWAILLVPCVTALAQGSWSDNFDSYLVNSQLHGQGGWKGWDNNPAFGALVSNSQSRSAPHSVSITANSDLVQEYSGHTSGEWVYTAWQYIPSGYNGEGYFILLNTYNDGGPKSWSVQVHFRNLNSRVISDFDGNWLPLIRGRWVELRVEIDLDTDRQTFYYDDQILYQNKVWSTGVSGAGQRAIEAVDLYANNSSPIYYDDISLKSASSTVVSSSANPSECGFDVTLTATINSLSPLADTPTGTVDFYEGVSLLGSSLVNASGEANIVLSGLSLGPHSITANYSGDSNYAASSGGLVQSVVDTTSPTIGTLDSVESTGDGQLSPGENTRADITRLLVSYSEDVYNPPGNTDLDDVTNPSNYQLIFDPSLSAIPVTIDSVLYNSANKTATVYLNGGIALETGSYQFIVKGTPSIQDQQGNPLDGNGDGTGGDDFELFFNILPERLPETGFAPGRITDLPPPLPRELFIDTGLRLIIPELGKDLDIVGVPISGNNWNVDWLGTAAGYLKGTAFPTWEGNTVITGHAYLPSGLPGPFSDLDQLAYGDQIEIRAWGKRYRYEVFSKEWLDPTATEALEHSDLDQVTLITCRNYNSWADSYLYRIVVKAVLVDVLQ